MLAVNLALSLNERSLKKLPMIKDANDEMLRDVEAGTYLPTVNINDPSCKQTKHFPVFIIGMSILQVQQQHKIENFI